MCISVSKGKAVMMRAEPTTPHTARRDTSY